MVGPGVPGASQVHYIGDHRLGCCVGRFASAMVMSDGGRAVLPVGRQGAPGVARTHSHQLGRLIQRNLLCQQAVQNLKSRLLFRGQSHILHSVNVTFLLAS